MTDDVNDDVNDAEAPASLDDERPLRARFVCLDESASPPLGVVVYEAKDPGAAVDAAIKSGAPAPYGAVLWDSAVALAARLWQVDLHGRRFLELGAGCGLVGLVAALGGARVLCTDVDEHTLIAVRRGATDAGVVVDTAPFDLCGAEALPDVAGAVATDVVLADVLYEPGLAAAAARRCRQALALGARVWVGDPDRVPRKDFIRLLNDAGIDATFDGNVCVLEPTTTMTEPEPAS